MENDVFGSLANIENELKKQLEDEIKAAVAQDGGGEPEDDAAVQASQDEQPEHHDEIDDAGAADDAAPHEAQDDAGRDDKKKNSAWARMRNEQKELRERLEAENREKQELRERLAKLEGRAEASGPTNKQTSQEDADNEPDRDLYPDDHLAWRQRQLDKKQAALDERLSRFEQESNVQRAQRAVETLESDYKQSNPTSDYDGAVKFLVERERSIKKLMNPNMTDAQINGQIQLEKMQLFANLHQQGKNPAQFVYETAKIHGFASQGGQPSSQQTQNKVNLQRVADNQRRASNLIGGSAASPNNGSKLSAEQILGMSMQEQAKMYAKNPRMFEESVS